MWEKGDIVQIDPDHDEIFGAGFMVVTKPKSWGAEGYLPAPGQDGLAYYRVNFDNAVRVGRAEWMVREGSAEGMVPDEDSKEDS